MHFIKGTRMDGWMLMMMSCELWKRTFASMPCLHLKIFSLLKFLPCTHIVAEGTAKRMGMKVLRTLNSFNYFRKLYGIGCQLISQKINFRVAVLIFSSYPVDPNDITNSIGKFNFSSPHLHPLLIHQLAFFHETIMSMEKIH